MRRPRRIVVAYLRGGRGPGALAGAGRIVAAGRGLRRRRRCRHWHGVVGAIVAAAAGVVASCEPDAASGPVSLLIGRARRRGHTVGIHDQRCRRQGRLCRPQCRRGSGGAVAEGCGLGEGNAVVGLLSTLTVAVTVLVAVAIWSVGVADGSVVAVAVAVSSGATTVCWEVAVGAGARASKIAKGHGQSCRFRAKPATMMTATTARAIAAWAQDGCQREKPE